MRTCRTWFDTIRYSSKIRQARVLVPIKDTILVSGDGVMEYKIEDSDVRYEVETLRWHSKIARAVSRNYQTGTVRITIEFHGMESYYDDFVTKPACQAVSINAYGKSMGWIEWRRTYPPFTLYVSSARNLGGACAIQRGPYDSCN